MPDSTVFGFGTPFEAQIEYLRQKLSLPTDKWDDITRSAHDRAFIVAGVAKADLLADLHAAVSKSATDGAGLQAFRKDFKAIVAKNGWTGWTGEGSAAGQAWRAQVIYQTNMSTSYAAGRYQQMSDPEVLKLHPYWRYIHSDGVLTPRPEHLAWHGLTLLASHPFWKTHFAPNGFGCHCRITSVSRAEGERSAAAGLGEPPAGWDAIDPKTGEQTGIGKSFGYAPGANVKASLQSLVDAKLMKLTPELAQALSQEAALVLGAQKPIQAVISTNRLDTMKNMTVADFKKFFDDEPNMPTRVAVASLTDADRKLYGTTATDLWLSRVSLDEHIKSHPEVTFEDYLRIPEIMQLAQVWAGHKDKRYLLLMLADKAYRAAIKIDASGDEAWFLSLVVSPKQKPPKGAVRIR